MTKEKISSSFQFNGLILGTDLIWHLKLKLNNVVPESWKYCKIKFVYDDTELQGQISERSDDLKQCKKNPTLWEEENYGSQKAIEQEITSLKKDLKARQDTIKDMNFNVEIEQVSYKDGAMIFLVPVEIIEKIDSIKHGIGDYIIEINKGEAPKVE